MTLENPEIAEQIFGEIYQLYSKYRWKVLQPEDMVMLSTDLRNFAEKYGWKENPLTWYMANAIFDTFDEMYKDGKTPPMPDYIGRSDL